MDRDLEQTHHGRHARRHRLPPAWGWWLFALVPFAVLVGLHWSIGPLLEASDYAQYLLHANALLDASRSYTDIGYITTAYNTIIGPPAEPPGLPITLVPLLAMFGPNLMAGRILMVLFALAFLVLVGAYFRRDEPARTPWVALGVTLLLGVSLEANYETNTILADLGFSAFVWGIILLLDGDAPWRTRRLVALTVLGVAALSYRAAALPLVPALLLFAGYRVYRAREAGARARELRLLLPAAAWAVAAVALTVALPTTSSFASQISLEPMALARSILAAIAAYRLGLFEAVLYPTSSWLANAVYHVATLALIGVGLVSWLRHAWSRFAVIFAAGYLAMLLLAPVYDPRYLMPITPIALFALLEGTRIVIAWVAARWRRTAREPIAARGAFASALAIGVMTIVTQATAPRPPALMEHGDVRDLFRQLEASAAQRPMRLLFINPRVLTWETGIPAMPMFTAPPDVVLRELEAKCVTHVVTGDLDLAPSDRQSLQSAMAAAPDAFAYEYGNRSFAVYAFRRPCGGGTQAYEAGDVEPQTPAVIHAAQPVSPRSDD